MSIRKIPANFEELWANPNNKFILRYKNIDEQYQKILAKRIKETTNLITLRRSVGPTAEEIHELLLEINPIIFAEAYDSRNEPYAFSKNNTYGINGWIYKRLCQGIYKALCKRRPMDTGEIEQLAYTIQPSYSLRRIWERSQEQYQNQGIERPLPHQEIDLQTINNATNHLRIN